MLELFKVALSHMRPYVKIKTLEVDLNSVKKRSQGYVSEKVAHKNRITLCLKTLYFQMYVSMCLFNKNQSERPDGICITLLTAQRNVLNGKVQVLSNGYSMSGFSVLLCLMFTHVCMSAHTPGSLAAANEFQALVPLLLLLYVDVRKLNPSQ